MSNSPTSFRLPFVLSDQVSPEIQSAIRYAFSGLKDLNDSIVALKGQTSTSTTVTTSVSGGASGSTSIASLGLVNQQSTGNYALGLGDFGAIVVLSTTPTFTVTLASFVTPFFAFISNQCAGVAILNPESGTVNGDPSWPVPPGGLMIVAYDGTNWWAAMAWPQNTPPIPSNFITGYDSATGEFYQSEIVIDSGGSITLDSGATIICDSGSTIEDATLTGTTSIKNLQIFANNGAALSGGLIAGNLYRDGGNPDHLCVVH